MLVQYALTFAFLGVLGLCAYWFRRRFVKRVLWDELRQTLGLVPSLQCVVRRSPADPWTSVDRFEGSDLALPNGDRITKKDVQDVVIAYSDGELFANYGTLLPLPHGFRFSDGSAEAGQHSLSEQQVAAADKAITVAFGPVRSTILKGPVYATTLTNLTAHPIRVRRFVAFAKAGDSWELGTITGAYFTAKQFISWYGAPESGWLPPGTAVTDHFNYGGSGSLWLYEFEAADGTVGVAAGVTR